MFPTVCVDGFYNNPDEVRKFALEQNFEKTNGDYPGERTDYIHVISPELFEDFCKKLFSCFYDFDTVETKWTVSTYFQKIYPFSTDPTDIINTGWVHKDEADKIMAGVIYLNPTPNINGGTSLFSQRLGKNDNDEMFERSHQLKKQFFRDEPIDVDLYRSYLKYNHDNFTETARFNSVYNRMVGYNSDIYHRANSFYGDEPRLTQVFFVHTVTTNYTPIQRLRKHSYK